MYWSQEREGSIPRSSSEVGRRAAKSVDLASIMNMEMAYAAFTCIMSYIHDPKDRCVVSEVCRTLYELEGLTRNHVTISFCYSTTPQRLRQRFRNLQSLKVKGRPKSDRFELILKDWGDFATPWVREIAHSFHCLRSLHFCGMTVLDSDLELLAHARPHALESLKLHKCSGFSTDGLFHIGRSCRKLKTLFLEESTIVEKDGKWVHELATNNTVLETLNFQNTQLFLVESQHLQLLANNCRGLISVKVCSIGMFDLVGFFNAVGSNFEEFCGASFESEARSYFNVALPPNLHSLGLNFWIERGITLVFPIANLLKKLDLSLAFLDSNGISSLIRRCPNLQVLKTRATLGDTGLHNLARHCKNLKSLTVGPDLMGVEGIFVSDSGLIALAEGCLELEHLDLYATDITNSALECIGAYSKNLSDFRLFLSYPTDFPLDNGIRALLRGCSRKMRRFSLHLRSGGLTDIGLGYIGRYSPNVTWMLLRNVGESDAGLLEFSRGCPSLQKLEIIDCCFTQQALAASVLQLTSLKCLWFIGHTDFVSGRDLLAMASPFWNIEFNSKFVDDDPSHLLAYYSLAGPRTDRPISIVSLDSSSSLLRDLPPIS